MLDDAWWCLMKHSRWYNEWFNDVLVTVTDWLTDWRTDNASCYVAIATETFNLSNLKHNTYPPINTFDGVTSIDENQSKTAT